MKQEERRLYLIRELLHEQPRYRNIEISKDHAEQEKLKSREIIFITRDCNSHCIIQNHLLPCYH